MKLGAVVVTYNRLAQVEVTVARLLAEPLDVLVVVDNGSTDGTRERLRAWGDPRLDLVESPENIGGAGGFDLGMRHITKKHDPDWIVVMDDDARPEVGALARFRQTDLAPYDGVAAAVYYPDGRICEMNRPWVNPFWNGRVFLKTLFGGGRAAFHIDDDAYDASAGAHPLDGGSFVGLFLSRDAIARAGFPDPRLFIYGDDVLYTLGLSEKGGKIAFLPDIRFEHDCETLTEGRQIVVNWKIYYHYRNLLLVYHRAAGWLFWPGLFLILPKWFLKARKLEGEARATYLRLLKRAVRDGLFGRLDGPKPEGLS